MIGDVNEEGQRQEDVAGEEDYWCNLGRISGQRGIGNSTRTSKGHENISGEHQSGPPTPAPDIGDGRRD